MATKARRPSASAAAKFLRVSKATPCVGARSVKAKGAQRTEIDVSNLVDNMNAPALDEFMSELDGLALEDRPSCSSASVCTASPEADLDEMLSDAETIDMLSNLARPRKCPPKPETTRALLFPPPPGSAVCGICRNHLLCDDVVQQTACCGAEFHCGCVAIWFDACPSCGYDATSCDGSKGALAHRVPKHRHHGQAPYQRAS